MTSELYSKLICALTHNLTACETCQKCGSNSVEARMNIIKQLAKECKKDVPWDETHYENGVPQGN